MSTSAIPSQTALGAVPAGVYSVQAAGDVLTVVATGKVDRCAHQITKLKGMAGRYLTLAITATATRIA